MPELSDLAAKVLSWAKDAEEVETYVAWEKETWVRAYQGEVESLSSAESAGAGIRVVLGDRQGFAYAGSLDEELLAETLAEARDNARFATPDPDVALPDPDGVEAHELDLWGGDDSSSLEEKISLAIELERAVRAADSRIRNVESTDYAESAVEVSLASTRGVASSSRRSTFSLSTNAVAGEGDDTQTAWAASAGRSYSSLDVDRVVREAVTRATRLLGARKPHSGRIDVVLEPRVSATLLSILGGTLSGESVLKGRSMFAGRLGESVGAPDFTLVDDPTLKEAFGASTHDAEGLACRRNVLIRGGVLNGFLYDSYSARRAHERSTGSAVRAGFRSAPGAGFRALSLEPGSLTLEEILEGLDEGLLVQSISGVHSGVNPVSGDFSVGAQGLMVRNGALAEPIREATVASTLQRMLSSIRAIGSEVEWLPGAAAGTPLVIGDMSLSGN